MTSKLLKNIGKLSSKLDHFSFLHFADMTVALRLTTEADHIIHSEIVYKFSSDEARPFLAIFSNHINSSRQS